MSGVAATLALPLMRAARADRFDPEAQFLFDLETALDGLAKRVDKAR